MPTYDFQCSRCNHKFTVITSIAEKDRVTCPKCRSKEIRQLFTGCGINLGG
ncbi:MAG: zinc ribbon domain-containing protein, partial [Firmicutes bacterium]|nr:zinc ribbon domain-containing protein [Bacillota bacterium]